VERRCVLIVDEEMLGFQRGQVWDFNKCSLLIDAQIMSANAEQGIYASVNTDGKLLDENHKSY